MNDRLLTATEISFPPVLHDLAFEVSDRHVVQIRGRSGAGKSSFLRTLIRATPTHYAQIMFRGSPVRPESIVQFRSNVQYLPQSPELREETVEEVLREPFSFRAHAEKPFDAGRAKELLDRLALESIHLSTSISQLSSGERQRLALLRSLLLDPTVLLLDEPTSVLDEETASITLRTLLDQYANRTDAWGIVIATHAKATTISQIVPPGVTYREQLIENGGFSS